MMEKRFIVLAAVLAFACSSKQSMTPEELQAYEAELNAFGMPNALKM